MTELIPKNKIDEELAKLKDSEYYYDNYRTKKMYSETMKKYLEPMGYNCNEYTVTELRKLYIIHHIQHLEEYDFLMEVMADELAEYHRKNRRKQNEKRAEVIAMMFEDLTKEQVLNSLTDDDIEELANKLEYDCFHKMNKVRKKLGQRQPKSQRYKRNTDNE